MGKGWRQGEVAGVTVSLESGPTSRLSGALFKLEVTAWSCFLHPASCQVILDTGRGCSYSVVRTYKDLAALHKQMQWLYTDLPPFPPKKWVVMNTDTSLQRRIEQLNAYFARLLEIGEIRRSQVLMNALCPSIVLSLRVIGPLRSCKSFVRNFLHYSPVVKYKAIRSSTILQPCRENGQVDWTLPVDLIVDENVLRITAIDLIEEEDSPWLLRGVQNRGIVLVAKEENSGNGQQTFAERRWLPGEKAVDTEQQGKEAFEAVCSLVKDYLKLVRV